MASASVSSDLKALYKSVINIIIIIIIKITRRHGDIKINAGLTVILELQGPGYSFCSANLNVTFGRLAGRDYWPSCGIDSAYASVIT